MEMLRWISWVGWTATATLMAALLYITQQQQQPQPNLGLLLLVVSACACACVVMLLLLAMARSVDSSSLRRRTEHERESELSVLRDERERLIQANESKSSFIATMAHEFRTSIHSIMASGEFLQATRLTSEQQAFLSTIRTCVRSLRSLINNVLELSAIESRSLRIQNEEFDLHQSLQDIVGSLAPIADAKGLTMHLFIDDTVDFRCEYLLGDCTRVRQILINLLGNAIKFTNEGIVKLVVHKTQEVGDQVSLEFDVIDTGPGVPPEFVRYLYCPFSRYNDAKTAEIEGTGLGLPLCYELVKVLGGELQYKPGPQGGSVFYFSLTFPIVRKDMLDEASGTSLLSKLLEEQMKWNVHVFTHLYDETVRHKVRLLLQSWGFLVSELDTLQEILAVARFSNSHHRQRHIIVLLDGLNELNAFLQESFPIPVLFPTTCVEFPEVSQFLRSFNTDAYAVSALFKPFGPLRLLTSMQHAMKYISRHHRRRAELPISSHACLPVPLAERPALPAPSPLGSNFVAIRSDSADAASNGQLQRRSARLARAHPDAGGVAAAAVGPVSSAMSNGAIAGAESSLESGFYRTSLKNMFILIAEDNLVNQQLLKRFMQSLGCVVECASDGKEAVDRVERRLAEAGGENYDFIFMDLQMPVMGGLSATQTIRASERSSHCKKQACIIALTGYALEEHVSAAYDAGCNGFLTKPVDMETLAGFMLNTLQHQQLKQLYKSHHLHYSPL